MRPSRALTVFVNTAYHLIWRMHNREFRLGTRENKRIYLKAVCDDVKSRVSEDEFVIYGYCIMSNHIHRIGKLLSESKALSEHMRRSHSQFGSKLNRQEKRSGAVGDDRPTTQSIEDVAGEMTVLFYILTNPVRAGICKDPKDIKLRASSSCRFMAYGERTEYTDMLTLPEWYLSLGSTPERRQAKFRALLDDYLIEKGLKRDSKMSEGLYIGSKEWADNMLKIARDSWRAKKERRDLAVNGFT